MELAKQFSLFSLDIIYHILQYDRRFVIQKGKILRILSPIDHQRKDLVQQMIFKKPKIRIYNCCFLWTVCQVHLAKKYTLSYSIDEDGEIIYELSTKNTRYFTLLEHMILD